MAHDRERAEIVEFGRRSASEGLSVGTSGNLSIRVAEGVLITPSGRDPFVTEPSDICLVSMDGDVLSGDLRPSSEVPMHLAVYRSSDASAVVHTHSAYATTLSLTHHELPAVHYTINGLGGPVRVAGYATFGTAELAANIAEALVDRSAAILQNHGAITHGSSLRQAYDRSVLLEWLCTLYWRSLQIGAPNILTAEQLDEVRAQSARLRYGAAR